MGGDTMTEPIQQPLTARQLIAILLCTFGLLGLGGINAYEVHTDASASAFPTTTSFDLGAISVDVYVVQKLIPKGADAETIKASVALETIPDRLKQPSVVKDLSEVDGQVAAVDLQPGDQLLSDRFVPASTPTSVCREGQHQRNAGEACVSDSAPAPTTVDPQIADLCDKYRSGDAAYIEVYKHRSSDGRTEILNLLRPACPEVVIALTNMVLNG
jgi:hypothetical protein